MGDTHGTDNCTDRALPIAGKARFADDRGKLEWGAHVLPNVIHQLGDVLGICSRIGADEGVAQGIFELLNWRHGFLHA